MQLRASCVVELRLHSRRTTSGPQRQPRSTLGSCRARQNKLQEKTMDLGLKGRGVIVAASSQGLGRATAEAFPPQAAQFAIYPPPPTPFHEPPHQPPNAT